MITIDYDAGLANNPPGTPTAVVPSCTTSNGLAVINWTPPPPIDVDGDAVVSYRIYRDPVNSPHPEYSSLANVINYGFSSYTDPTPTGGTAHTYYIAAVDQRFQESAELRVDWTPGGCP
jgi:hypothetical protein